MKKYAVILGLALSLLTSQAIFASHWTINISQGWSDCQTFWSNGIKYRECNGGQPYPEVVCHRWISRHGYVHQSCSNSSPYRHCTRWISKHGYIHERCY